MPLYEMVVITSVHAPLSRLALTLRRAGANLNASGGMMRRIDNWGVRPLAQRIRAHKQYNQYGRYLRVMVHASPFAMTEARDAIKLNEDILRVYSIKQKMIAPKQPPYQIGEHKHVPENDVIVAEPFRENYRRINYEGSMLLVQAGLVKPQEFLEMPMMDSYDATTKKGQDLAKQLYLQQFENAGLKQSTLDFKEFQNRSIARRSMYADSGSSDDFDAWQEQLDKKFESNE